LVKQGNIPSIKVFRLNGIDSVRGYYDDEINVLENGEDISDLVIDESAYFVNFKFEPRYTLDDNTMLGIFFDAGRLFVNHFKPLKVRTSIGLSFKYLTPVGSLNFDYGVKTERRVMLDNRKERFGRFHLTIGVF
jgi:outer membrane protein insertion porin family